MNIDDLDSDILRLEALKSRSDEIFSEIEKVTSADYSILSRSDDDISPPDIAAMVIFGIAGSAISNNEKLKELLDDIHTDASLKHPKTLLGKLLHHTGDNIDHVTRGGKSFATYLHRLYGGHDPFSIKGDNPFVVLCKQYGIPKGIIQAIRHLIADPFSKNGGVLPFSSFLDFTKEDGTVGNYLDEWSKEAAKGTGLSPQEAYAELFSIKAQDIGATTVTIVLAKLYIKIRNEIYKNQMRINSSYSKQEKYFSRIAESQLKLIALMTNIAGSATWGMIKHGGIPKVSIPAVLSLIRELITFFCLNYKDLKNIEGNTQLIMEDINLLENDIYIRAKILPSYETRDEYNDELDRGYNNFEALLSRSK
ncbi:MAG: hypothetical protein LBQ46_05075 [Treponema sp.]|jgi:hypothetical protein|nr:hypothetical protein [Treponema sp.]